MTAQASSPSGTPSPPSNHAAGSGNRPRNAIGCARCDNWWTGWTSCHCGACHETFTGLRAFDTHRAGSHAKGTRHCVDPATIRSEKTGERLLIPADKPWPGWSLPGTWRGPE